MISLEELEKKEFEYIKSLRRMPAEGDWDSNKFQRAKIRAFKRENNGICYIGKINGNCELKEYNRGMIYNFECDYAVPVYDENLVELIKEHNRPKEFNSKESMQRIDKIMQRIDRLSGILLSWV